MISSTRTSNKRRKNNRVAKIFKLIEAGSVGAGVLAFRIYRAKQKKRGNRVSDLVGFEPAFFDDSVGRIRTDGEEL